MSCSKRDYLVFGNQSIPRSKELKSFAFASVDLNQQEKEWTDSQKAIFSELRRRNYFYDDQNPEMLVFISNFPERVSFLSGNYYQGQNGKPYLEKTKIRTKENTVFIQFVETAKHEILWRGFSYAGTGNVIPLSQSILSRAILNQ